MQKKWPETWKRLTAHFSISGMPRVMNLLQQLTSLSLKPSEKLTDYLIRVETFSSLSELEGEKISEKVLVSVVLRELPDNLEYFKTAHDFCETAFPFSDLKKSLKCVADSQKMKDCGNWSNTKSDAALFVSPDIAEKFFGKNLRCNGSGHMTKSSTVEYCSTCKNFRQSGSKCF